MEDQLSLFVGQSTSYRPILHTINLMSLQVKIVRLRALLQKMSLLPQADLMGQDTDGEWMTLGMELSKIGIDEFIIEKELSFPKYEKLRMTINALNSKLKDYNENYEAEIEKIRIRDQKLRQEQRQLKLRIQQLRTSSSILKKDIFGSQ